MGLIENYQKTYFGGKGGTFISSSGSPKRLDAPSATGGIFGGIFYFWCFRKLSKHTS